MTGGEVAALISGVLVFIGTIYGTWRAAQNDKSKNRSDSAAVLLGGWRDFQAETLKEVDRVRKSCQQEIAELKKEHAADSAQWYKEKKEMQEEIDRLKAQVIILIEAKAREGR